MMRIYQYRFCPFCGRVREELAELGLKEGEDYELIDALPGTEGSVELLRLGGKQQAPFIVDGEIMMYESGDIIAYIENKFKGRKQNMQEASGET